METRRQLQVSELIKRHFSVVMQQEGSYIHGSSVMVSVTNVMMTPDLGMAKIYLSVFNTENKGAVIQMISESKHRLKQLLAGRIRKLVRRIPEIDFYIDDTIDEMYKVEKLFDNLDEDTPE